MLSAHTHGVIPGRERQRANPKSITRSAAEYDSGFRPSAGPGMTKRGVG